MSLTEDSSQFLSSFRRKSWIVAPIKDDDEANSKVSTEKVPLLKSYRKWITLICTVSMIITFSAQASMSSAIVCIVPAETENDTLLSGNQSSLQSGNPDSEWRFNWNKDEQGWVLSSFFMGYLFSQLPSGLASTKFGPKNVLVVGLFLTSVFQVLAVPAAKYGLGYLYADRVVTGIVDGLLYAPTFALVGQWTPKTETSLLFAIVGSGMESGNMVSFLISTFACEINVQGGWPFLFYILSALGLLTMIAVVIFMSDSPFTNKYISAKELKYIAGSVPKHDKNNTKLSKVPMKSILTSMPVWAIAVSQIGGDWFYYFFASLLPQYLKEVLKLSEMETNILSGVPFAFALVTISVTGYMSDRIITKKILSATRVRKINDFVSKIVPASVLLAMGFLPEKSVATVFVLNAIMAAALSFAYVSWMTNPIDLAPPYTGVIVALCEGTCLWVAVVAPILVDNITVDKTREQWQLTFYITSGLQVVTYIFYAIFASGELQPWAQSSYDYKYSEIDIKDMDPNTNSNTNEPFCDKPGPSGISRSIEYKKKLDLRNSLAFDSDLSEESDSFSEELMKRSNRHEWANERTPLL